jgi:prepilin-type N-terminal cleavage/methylation domain-containing protein
MKIRSYRNLISKFKKGFSLVELLVSISIFLVFVIAVTEVTTSVSKESRNSANKQRAAVLAEEAVEAVRNIRDANFDNLVDGVHGLATTSNEWSLAGSSDLTDIFTRAITISTVNPNQKKVDVLITWADQIEPNNSFSLSTYLTNWRAILNVQVGLTVNKSVINHGGSKVAADFGPFLVGTTTVTLGAATLFNEGVYTVSESTDPNYTQTFSGDCNSGGVVNLVADTVNTCLITNEEKPSMLTVTKNVINHGLSKVASDFTLKVDTNPVVSGATNIFNSGVHTVSETPDSAYNLTISGDCDSGGLVTLFPNTTKSCILTNEEKLSSIVVNKYVINHGGSKVASNFAPYKVDAITVTLGATTTFDSGTYTVSETVDPAYTASFSGDCGPGGSVTLTAGSTKVCNITNEENLVVPTVTTPTVASITNTTATLGANVTSLGVPNSISARGTCWGTSPSPSTNCLAEGGVGTGVFTQARTGFTAGTPYYYRGYAVNTTGTGYSPDGTFTTTASCSVASSVVGTPTLYDSAASVTATVNKPTGVVQGDIMFAYILHNNAVDRLTTIPSGWLPVGSRRKNASVNQALYYKVAGASEGASYAFGFSASSKIGVTISAYRGCFNTSNPIETFSDSIYVVNNTTYRAGSVTLSAGSTVLMFPSMYTTAVRTFANPLTQGGGWTEDYDQGSTASDFSRAAYRKFIPTLGATGVIDSIGTSGGTVKHAYGVVLRPL